MLRNLSDLGFVSCFYTELLPISEFDPLTSLDDCGTDTKGRAHAGTDRSAYRSSNNCADHNSGTGRSTDRNPVFLIWPLAGDDALVINSFYVVALYRKNLDDDRVEVAPASL